MISHWLHETPEEDVEKYPAQVAKATWLENRYFKKMAKAMGTLDE